MLRLVAGERSDWEAEEERFAAAGRDVGDPTGWFDDLYGAGAAGRISVPWSRTEPHPLLSAWTGARALRGEGRTALVVGCALGADAEHVAGLGYATTAFDVAPTAVGLARERHPASPVDYVVADLLDPPDEWTRAFDLVVEIITAQSLPEPHRARAILNIGRFVAPGGVLFVVAAIHDDDQVLGPADPFPLRRDEVEAIAADGLTVTSVAQLPVPGQSGAVRWQAEFVRPSAA